MLIGSPIAVRMPDDMRENIERAAEANGRSLNQEIVRRLRESAGVQEDAGPRTVGQSPAPYGESTAVDLALLETCLAGALNALRAHDIDVPPAKLAQLVTLLYGYYETRGGAPDDVTFARFIALAS